SHPVAYEAQWIGKTKQGLQQFRLNMVAPLLGEEECSAVWHERIWRACARSRNACRNFGVPHRNETVTQYGMRWTDAFAPDRKELAGALEHLPAKTSLNY